MMTVAELALSPFARKAHRILSGHVRPMTARSFAECMWPDAPGWQRRSKCGNRNTAVIGSAMPRMAGSHLMRLVKAGLVRRHEGEAPTYQPTFSWINHV